jgi:Calcineurin-like phosphoesterase
MRLIATADLHGRFPKIQTCDVLVIAGDVLPIEFDRDDAACLLWCNKQFGPWLESLPAKYILGIGGNHDWLFDLHRMYADELPWTYLVDSGVEIDGIRFWGTPWVPNLQGWAYYGSPATLEAAFGAVPEDIDVVISHSPPKGHLDNPERLFGASQINDMLKRVKPKAFICGHIHEGYGVERGYRKHTDLYNVAHCDILYNPVNEPVAIEIEVEIEV